MLSSLSEALRATERFIQHWPRGVALAFTGGYGIGKTHLIAQIYAAAWAQGLTAIYTTGPALERLFLDFRTAAERDEGDITPLQAWHDHIFADILLLDEADRQAQQNGNSWGERKGFDLIDTRLSHNRSVVLAGNALEQRLHP
ncbi:MAG: ATP-binding protein, partial [Ardenticatenales bacterium]|nr:ATP-binding protein [Ardenticatenales bacterium]